MNNTQKQQVQQLLTNAEKHLHRMFLAGCIFGALSCFGRADFNLPLYAFLYIMWDQDDVSNARSFAKKIETRARWEHDAD